MLKRCVVLFVIFLLLFPQFIFLTPTAHAATNFTNPNFETDLSNWSPTYSLLDQFDTARSAGSVNGTSAEPTGGSRTVTDTNSKLSITGGLASFATAGSGENNPALWYPVQTRVLGKLLIASVVNNSGTNQGAAVGWDTNQTGGFVDRLAFAGFGNFTVRQNVSADIPVGTYTDGQTYHIALLMRSAGLMWLIKGGTQYPSWTLLTLSNGGTTTFPAVGAMGVASVFTADNIRIPTSTFIPTPTAYDTFTTPSSTSTETTGPDSQSVSSLPWTGSTWTVTGGSISNTPTEGSELLTDGGLENWTTSTNLTSWSESLAGTSTINQETSIVHGGSSSSRADIDASNNNAGPFQQFTAPDESWISINWWGRTSAAGKLLFTNMINNQSLFAPSRDPGTTWTNFTDVYRTTVANPVIALYRSSAASSSLYFDDISAKVITTSTLFRTVDSGNADAIIEANTTATLGSPAGLVLNLDSTSNPQNLIIVYLSSTNGGTSVNQIKVDEAVAGVYTNKASTAVTYSAGATLRAIKYGNSLDVYYNNAKVGSTLTMTANTNTRMGLFSTSSTNTFDNFAIWPRSGYNLPDIVVSRDTTTTYGGSTGSAKVVGGANAATFTESVNLGDSRNYTLSTYAYTNGSAVTSSDLVLYGNGHTIPTTYTDAGSGWYLLTGTVMGDTSAVDYGIQVQADKTVYVDNFNLTQQALSGGGGTTVCTDPAPGSSPIINSSSSTTNSITLNFTKATDPVSYYALEYGTTSGNYPYGSTNIGGKDTTSYTVNLLNPNTNYYFRVRAGNGCTPGAWSNEYSAKTTTLTGGAYLPVQPVPQLPIPTVPLPAPAPTISPAPPEPSPTPISFTFPTIQWPQISLPTITLPEIHLPVIALPTITLPQIAFPVFTWPTLAIPPIAFTFTLPRITLPVIAINLNPLLTFFRSTFSGIGNFTTGLIAFVKESIAYAGYIASNSYTRQSQAWGKIGDWLSYVGTSFSEIVLDKEPTRILEVYVRGVSPTKAVIYWRTNHLSDSKVNYGLTLDYGQYELSNEKVHEHILEINNLKPGTKYFYEVMSQNKNYVFDAWHEFETPSN